MGPIYLTIQKAAQRVNRAERWTAFQQSI